MNINFLAILLFFIMFIYSGFTKIFDFNKTVNILKTKTNLPLIINQFGMICVIILEIFGSLILILDEYYPNIISKKITKFIYVIYMLFMIVVTLLYHPPGKTIIPFLSNLTTFGGFLYIYNQKYLQ